MNIVTSAKIPTARITFRGLVVEGSEPTSPDGPHFHPWASLNPPGSREGMFWSVVMEQGESNAHAPPRIFFRLQGVYENWLARRAWRRAVQRDWQRPGSVHVIRQRAPFRHPVLLVIVAIAGAVGIWSVLPIELILTAWRSPFHPDLPDAHAYTQLFRIVAVLYFAIMFGPCLALAMCPVYYWLRPYAVYASFDQRRILAVLCNRQRVSAPWSDLVDCSKNRLLFKGKQALRFRMLDRRSDLILQNLPLAGSSYRPLTPSRYLLRAIWPTMRCPALAACIILLAAWLPVVRREFVILAALSCFGLGCCLLAPVALVAAGPVPRSMRPWRLVKWIQRRRRPRRRRATHP